MPQPTPSLWCWGPACAILMCPSLSPCPSPQLFPMAAWECLGLHPDKILSATCGCSLGGLPGVGRLACLSSTHSFQALRPTVPLRARCSGTLTPTQPLGEPGLCQVRPSGHLCQSAARQGLWWLLGLLPALVGRQDLFCPRTLSCLKMNPATMKLARHCMKLRIHGANVHMALGLPLCGPGTLSTHTRLSGLSIFPVKSSHVFSWVSPRYLQRVIFANVNETFVCIVISLFPLYRNDLIS